MHAYIHIFTHTYMHACMHTYMRTNGVNTNGAAAKVMNSDRLGEKVRPDTLLEGKGRLMGVPKKSVCQTTYKFQ